MKNSFLIIILLSNLVFAQNRKLDDNEVKKLQNVIRLFKNKDVKGISEIVSYPFNRRYPIPDVKNKQEFVKRFNNIFDQSVINLISKSKVDDWSELGWRGIIWVSPEGKILALNDETDFEKKQYLKLVAEQKNKIHPSLKSFNTPIYKFKTKNYIIRIDELENETYRYASWKKSQPESSKPELILQKGILDLGGSGGNHSYTFKNGAYSYVIERNIIGAEDSSEIDFFIERNNKKILAEAGELLEE